MGVPGRVPWEADFEVEIHGQEIYLEGFSGSKCRVAGDGQVGGNKLRKQG